MPIKRSLTAMTKRSLKTLEKIIGKKPTLGDYLHALRECREDSQGDFAELLGVSRQYLCDIEKNRRVVSARMAAAFAKKLHYPPELFVRLALEDELLQAGLSYQVELIYVT